MIWPLLQWLRTMCNRLVSARFPPDGGLGGVPCCIPALADMFYLPASRKLLAVTRSLLIGLKPLEARAPRLTLGLSKGVIHLKLSVRSYAAVDLDETFTARSRPVSALANACPCETFRLAESTSSPTVESRVRERHDSLVKACCYGRHPSLMGPAMSATQHSLCQERRQSQRQGKLFELYSLCPSTDAPQLASMCPHL